MVLFQLAWLCVVAWVVSERALRLWFEAPVSADFLRELESAVRRGDLAAARGLSLACAKRWPARLVLTAIDAKGSVDLSQLHAALWDMTEAARARLAVIRVAATVSSLLGLLVAIEAMAAGFDNQQGLLALEAGLPQRLAFARALEAMAVGVGSAALCFDAYTRLRRSAQGVLRQLRAIAQAFESS